MRVHRSEQSLGLIVQRNRAAELARTPYLFSMDDDAVFSTPRVVETTLREFEHPRVGVVAIPFVNVNHSPALRQKAPGRERSLCDLQLYRDSSCAAEGRVSSPVGLS